MVDLRSFEAILFDEGIELLGTSTAVIVWFWPDLSSIDAVKNWSENLPADI